MLSNFAFSVPHPKKFVLSLSNGREGREAIRVCQWRGGARRINNLEAHNERNSTCYSLKHSAVISDLRCIRKPSNYHQIKCNYHAPSNHANVHDQKTDWLDELQNVACKQWDAFYRFSRPHTVIGTIIAITTVSVLPVETISDISPAFFLGLFKALVPAIFMNIYVVGLNQLFDVDIDKVNKPTLPLASGEFSMSTGIVLVAASCIMSFAMGVKSGSPPLLFALLISFLLGSAYSVDLPLLRWKRHAFLAASCILCVRAILVQLAFFMHIQRYVLGRPTVLKKSVIFATVFMCFFSAVIALFKDIPDVDGDRDYGIQSFSVRLGQKKVFWLCIKLLLTAYAIAMLVGASSCDKLRGLVTVFGHGSLASVLLLRARRLDVQNKTSITAFYMFIWKLFYAEYFLIPFVS